MWICNIVELRISSAGGFDGTCSPYVNVMYAVSHSYGYNPKLCLKSEMLKNRFCKKKGST